jgi:DNA-binding NarL/FixJ family response regulator
VPSEEGRYLASLIAGATFMAVESNHNMPLASDADWPATILAIERFLDGEARAPTAPSLTLTPRQVQVLRLITQGRTDKQIARELGLSHRTVEMHVARSMAALGCHTRAEAAARWVQLGQADG